MSLLIAGGLVVDPTQNLEVPRDLLIEGGKIAALEPPGTIPGDGRRVIEAQNLVVTPGLIDMHTHLTSSPLFAGYNALLFSDSFWPVK